MKEGKGDISGESWDDHIVELRLCEGTVITVAVHLPLFPVSFVNVSVVKR